MPLDITQAAPDRLSALAGVLGRAFVGEPMMRWPLGVHGDIEHRFSRGFVYFLEDLIPLGMVWEAEEALGAAVWVPAEQADAWRKAQLDKPEIAALTDDGGRRYDEFWEWVDSKIPQEPLWHLDSIGVEAEARGRGIGSALIRVGLDAARTARAGAWLETGSPGNVPLYEHFGFRVVEDAEAPGGGPRLWFMRWDP